MDCPICILLSEVNSDFFSNVALNMLIFAPLPLTLVYGCCYEAYKISRMFQRLFEESSYCDSVLDPDGEA